MKMTIEIPYEFIGKLTFFAFIAITILLSIGLFLAYLAFKKKRIFFPNFILFILDSLYIPSKKIIASFGGNETMIDIVGVEIRNMLLKEKFSEVPYNERIIVLPQCLRHLECPAKISPVDGIKCIKCKRCKIFNIYQKAESLGYKGLFIVPGSGFAKRIAKKFKPKAAVGIACPSELNLTMLEIHNYGLVGQGVLLSKTGCVTTDADLEEIFEVIEMKK